MTPTCSCTKPRPGPSEPDGCLRCGGWITRPTARARKANLALALTMLGPITKPEPKPDLPRDFKEAATLAAMNRHERRKYLAARRRRLRARP